jgi:phosphoglycerate dehydrogenase-like enzyme
MNTLYLTDAKEAHIAQLRGLLGDSIALTHLPRSATAEAVAAAGRFDAVVGGVIPREFLEAAGKLRYLVVPYAGVPQQDRENLRDFPHITILNSHFNAQAAAEHAWALLLAAGKRIVPICERLRTGDWSPRYEDCPSVGLHGATLLLIGYGAIGRRLGRMGRAFGMRVVAVKRSRGQAPEIDYLGTTEDLPDLLPLADAIIVSLPGTQATTGCVGERQFGLMKNGVLFVNVGRGAAVDEDAFYEALRSGRIGAAGIDTWWHYPRGAAGIRDTAPSRHPLGGFDNLVMSPHRASHIDTRESDRMRAVAEILNNIVEGKPVDVVDRDLWY